MMPGNARPPHSCTPSRRPLAEPGQQVGEEGVGIGDGAQKLRHVTELCERGAGLQLRLWGMQWTIKLQKLLISITLNKYNSNL